TGKPVRRSHVGRLTPDMAGLAEAVLAWEARRQETDEEGSWEADDVQVVAFEAPDQGRAGALGGVPAGPSLPLATAHVMREVARRQSPKRHPRRLAVQFLPRGRPQAKPRDDLVRPPRQPLEHRLGGTGARGLAERLPVHDDLGIHSEHRPIAAVPRPRLAGRQLDWIVTVLLEVRRDHVERNAELLENRPPLRRDGREN